VGSGPGGGGTGAGGGRPGAHMGQKYARHALAFGLVARRTYHWWRTEDELLPRRPDAGPCDNGPDKPVERLLACETGGMRGLTFEVRRDQRQDARPGLVKMYAYHQPGPGGLPLGLASTEGLGRASQDCGGGGFPVQ